MWKAIGKALGKAVGWIVRNPQALQGVLDAVAAAKAKKEPARRPDDPPTG